MTLHTFKSKGKEGAPGDSRCTPPAIWKPALVGAGLEKFDLDPATNDFSTVPADVKWFGDTKETNGLKMPWSGNIWLNPPFSAMNAWTDKVQFEIDEKSFKTLQMLVPGDSSTTWWKTLVRSCHVFATLAKRHHCPTPDQPKGSPGGNLNLLFWDFRKKNQLDRWEKVHRHIKCLTFRYRHDL